MAKPRILFTVILILASQFFSMASQKNEPDLTLKTIVIDAGHGGKDTGTISRDKRTYEKNVALSIASGFANKVRNYYPDMNVVMTRDRDVYVPLDTRAAIASEVGAQLFISIHINATAKGTSANGFSAYILGQSSSNRYDSYDINLEVCKRENSVIYLENDYTTKYRDYDPESPESEILMHLMQNAFREQSLAFAETVSSKMKNGPFRKDWGVMQGNFCVLRLASMPAVLLEFGFMTNSEDLETLRSYDNITAIVNNLFDAFVSYKADYDSSVKLDKTPEADGLKNISKPASQQKTESKSEAKQEKKPEVKPEVKPETKQEIKIVAKEESKHSVKYGTQVLVSAKLKSATDSIFMGYPVEIVPYGTMYKYIILCSEDISVAKESFQNVKKYFEGCFLVKNEDGVVTPYR